MTISTDIYKLSEYIDDLKKKNITDVSENTLAMGEFGYFGSVFSGILQNAIIVASEYGNEAIPIRAKFDRSILDYANTAKIKDINATPAHMDILIGLPESELLANMVSDLFTIDANIPIYIGKYEFHLDYNIKIRRSVISGQNVYVAQYDMSRTNDLSDITNPYILPPIQLKVEDVGFIFVKCKIRQVSITKSYNKIITDDSIENKSFEFSFDSQLSNFEIYVTNSSGTTEIKPMYDGLASTDENVKYCNYNWVDSSTIRIKFVKSSYEPALNDNIEVIIKCTEGDDANFTYSDDILVEPTSTEFNYNNITLIVKPMSDSEGGIDKKSITRLKEILPKELLSRGVITCKADLINYFQQLSEGNNHIEFMERIHNQFERSYYSYILLKDSSDNIIPTNTINIKLNKSDFDSVGGRLVLKPGAALVFDNAKGYSIRSNLTYDELVELEKTTFVYTIPFMIAISNDPLAVSYYLTVLDKKYSLDFAYINDMAALQFISTKLNWNRKLLADKDKYNVNFTITQNITEEKNLVVYDEQGNITSTKLKCIALFHNGEDEPLRYKELDLVSYDKDLFAYNFNLQLITDDVIDENSMIKITNLKDLLNTTVSTCYLPPTKSKISLYILADLGIEYGRADADKYFPSLDGYTLCNRYDVSGGVDFAINYTDTISSGVKVQKDLPTDLEYYYMLSSVPVLKYTYCNSESRFKYFIDYIIRNKFYIDDAMLKLEDNFNIDFKFFNTYGKSKIYTIGRQKAALDSISLTFKFRMSVDSTADENIKDILVQEIKTYIENINEINDIHISKLITYLQNKYNVIKYIEFVGINSYGSDYQIIERATIDGFYIPEFLNVSINTDTDTPNIIIELV